VLFFLPVALAASVLHNDTDTASLLKLVLARDSLAKSGPQLENVELLFGATDPEIRLGPAEIIQYWGYPVESYEATTEDGYELDVLRIPHGRNAKNDTSEVKRPVVFLQHGLDGSAADWVTNLPNQAAAFVLADAGFDVWLGNFRGNKYARFHKTLSPSEHSFWKFSWDEMARYDLPSMIDLALNTSQAEKLYYVGFSLGTTTAFAKFSQDREFAKKIKKFYALAPMATVSHIKGPLRYLAPFTSAFQTVVNIIGADEFAPNQWLMDQFAKYFCGNPVSNLLCKNILFLIGGPESNQLNATRIPVYLSHSPGGTSSRTIIHMGQMVRSGKFQAYDYGSKAENKKHYGQDKPLEYDVSQMEVPVSVYSGAKDWVSDPRDVQSLTPKLRNMVGNVYLPDFNDFDFIWGLRAAPEIYWPITNDIRADFAASSD